MIRIDTGWQSGVGLTSQVDARSFLVVIHIFLPALSCWTPSCRWPLVLCVYRALCPTSSLLCVTCTSVLLTLQITTSVLALLSGILVLVFVPTGRWGSDIRLDGTRVGELVAG